MESSPDAIRSISHDLRNLLTAVRGHADLALRGLSPDDPAREDVARVVVVTAAVFELIDQLDGLDASETQVATNLDSTVMSMRRLLAALLPASIELELDPDAPDVYVSISKLRVERIVLNLSMNARHAMPDGGTLTVATRPGPDGGAQIGVADTGTGFSEEALEHLFEIGFTTKRDSGGSGNGLAAVAKFVDSAGGSVDVDSLPGEGATIIVTLPTADLDEFRGFGEASDPVAEATETGDADVAEVDDPAVGAEADDQASNADATAEAGDADETEELDDSSEAEAETEPVATKAPKAWPEEDSSRAGS